VTVIDVLDTNILLLLVFRWQHRNICSDLFRIFEGV